MNIHIHAAYPKKLTQLHQKLWRLKHLICTLYIIPSMALFSDTIYFFSGGRCFTSPRCFTHLTRTQVLRSSTSKTQKWTTQEWTKPSAATLGVESCQSSSFITRRFDRKNVGENCWYSKQGDLSSKWCDICRFWFQVGFLALFFTTLQPRHGFIPQDGLVVGSCMSNCKSLKPFEYRHHCLGKAQNDLNQLQKNVHMSLCLYTPLQICCFLRCFWCEKSIPLISLDSIRAESPPEWKLVVGVK